MKTYSSFFVLASLLALVGAGCFSRSSTNSTPVTPGSSSSVSLEGLSPHDASRNLNLVVGDALVIQQSFSGSGATMASQLGWGTAVTTTAVVKRFAPSVAAEVEWTRKTSVQENAKQVDRVFDGTVNNGVLVNTYDLYLPSLWVEGVHPAFGTSLLWLARDEFENFDRSNQGTFRFGFFNRNEMLPIASNDLKQALNQLESDSLRSEAKDVTLTKVDAPMNWKLLVNGKEVTVEVRRAHNWFGSFVYLNNPQNPLILNVELDKKLVGGKLDGFFDYRVTEIKTL